MRQLWYQRGRRGRRSRCCRGRSGWCRSGSRRGSRCWRDRRFRNGRRLGRGCRLGRGSWLRSQCWRRRRSRLRSCRRGRRGRGRRRDRRFRNGRRRRRRRGRRCPRWAGNAGGRGGRRRCRSRRRDGRERRSWRWSGCIRRWYSRLNRCRRIGMNRGCSRRLRLLARAGQSEQDGKCQKQQLYQPHASLRSAFANLLARYIPVNCSRWRTSPTRVPLRGLVSLHSHNMWYMRPDSGYNGD